MFDQPSVAEARHLIESQGLRFEPAFDDLVGLYEDGRLLGCGARAGYVLKMIAIDPAHQGSDALGSLITQLLLSGLGAGNDTLFLFTLPRHVPTFEGLNFRLLASHAGAALLEHGPGLPQYLADLAGRVWPGRKGAVVINGNPFTLGHLHLVESAAREVDQLLVFIVREDRSVFPFEVRFELARQATAHLGNVLVLDTSRYAVSAGTFPSYFLKNLDDLAMAQMQLDLRLFAGRIAPALDIVSRFVGSEPLCPVTAAYNRVMAEVLAEYRLGCVEVPRIESAGEPISATRVRQALVDCDFDTLGRLVPPATLEFLRSSAAEAIAARIRTAREGA